MRQSSLPLEHAIAFDERDYVLSASNRIAYDTVLNPALWGSAALRLIGATGSGKSHLAAIFATRFPASEAIDAERFTEEALFHRLSRLDGPPLLLTATDGWRPVLPDLASRWNALPRAAIPPPDDMLLIAVLQKRLNDRQLRVSPDVLRYLEPRIERSLGAVALLVDRIDAEALEKSAPVTVRMVRRLLEPLEIKGL